ncbi:MAG: FHA domain-containing protein, partial [Nocardioides sp.]|uniref:FHA domain-containing protein n=1 Tax=Nocardioides sp. TaxID=35761 RepID=UPI003263AEC2
SFETADDLTTGRFRIRSQAEAQVTDNDQRTRTRSARAVLVVNGTRHPLRAPGLVVGRGTEADLRINDPGISRQHVEFIVNGDDLEVVDLGSTNGMLVNGTKAGRAVLHDGSEVKIGRTTMTVRVDGEA